MQRRERGERKVGDIFLKERGKRTEAYEVLGKGRKLRELNDRISAGFGRDFDVMDGIETSMDELLSIDLADIFMKGWKKYGAVTEVLERSKHSPLQKFYIALSEHTIHSSHRPRLEVEVEGVSLPSLIFEIDLDLKLEGFVLEIVDGEMVAIDSGACMAAGRVSCEGVVLYEKRSEKVELPVRMGFEGEEDG
ncbi:hypothetical protein [Hydrogenimonas sp.]